MKDTMIKWMSILALISFAAAVFMIADGYYWPGIAFIGAGTSLSSVMAVYKKKNEAADGAQERQLGRNGNDES